MSRVVRSDGGTDCLCGDRMRSIAIDGVLWRIECPRCGRQPIDLMERHQ